MLRFIVRRVLLMIPTLFVISALVYFIIDLPPGDCVSSQIDELLARGDADAHQRADELRELYGLNMPLWQRYLSWVSGIFRWDFGLSCQDTVPVADLIVMSALMRRESRGLHYSRDYPELAAPAAPTVLVPPVLR